MRSIVGGFAILMTVAFTLSAKPQDTSLYDSHCIIKIEFDWPEQMNAADIRSTYGRYLTFMQIDTQYEGLITTDHQDYKIIYSQIAGQCSSLEERYKSAQQGPLFKAYAAILPAIINSFDTLSGLEKPVATLTLEAPDYAKPPLSEWIDSSSCPFFFFVDEHTEPSSLDVVATIYTGMVFLRLDMLVMRAPFVKSDLEVSHRQRFVSGRGERDCDQTRVILRDWLEWSEIATGVKLPIDSFDFYFGDEATALEKKHLPNREAEILQ